MSFDRAELRARLRSLFEGELDDAVRGLNSGLVRLESAIATGEGPALIAELFRLAHGIKGAAHSADVPEAAAVAHRLEDALAELRDDHTVTDAARVATLLRDVDALADVHARLTEPPVGAAGGVAARPAVVAPAPAAPEADDVRVGIDKVGDVVEHASALVSASYVLDHELDKLAEVLDSGGAGTVDISRVQLLCDAARTASAAVARVSEDIREATRALGLQPFSAACSGLDRVVHDAAASSSKSARLVVLGGEIEVDRHVVGALREPLVHLVRNAVGHGIEDPTERASAGKAEAGTVTIEAVRRSGRLEITVRDDGRGLDREAIRTAAAALGENPDEDPAALVFRPRVTTAAAVTDLSGRGVGLDAVRDRMEAIGGSVQVLRSDDRGTSVQLVSPISLSLIDVLVVRSAEEQLCLPLSAVHRILQVDTAQLQHLDGVASLVVDTGAMPVVSLLSAAGFAGAPALEPGCLQVVVVEGGTQRAALVVDAVLGHESTTVQSLPARVEGLRNVLGVATLASGEHVLVLNPATCVGHARAEPARSLDVALPAATRARILLAEDTATTRALERSILEAAGYDVLVAVDGAEAWQLLQRHGADGVVSDVDMPRTDGIELSRLIRTSTRFADLPIVLVSSLGSDDDRRRGADAGASAYVVKSDFDQETLLDVLRRLL